MTRQGTPDTVQLAVIQMHMTDQMEDNLTRAEGHVRDAAQAGAQVILLPELFENLYFCQAEREDYFGLAHPVEGHPFIPRFQALARELGVVLPLSYFEAAGQAYYNSLVCIDADGEVLGNYRKTHIPDGPGYEEKYYFNPGDTGFKVWDTRFGRVGVGICWDQWYPETARAMMLLGADFLLYPTAIGTEPAEVESPNSHHMWQRAMQGHAVSNSTYVGSCNRVGTEVVEGTEQTYYGHSFVADYTGAIVGELDEAEEGFLMQTLDLAEARKFRAGMGFFRDRRPELYGPLMTTDGVTRRG
ncbi:N-carbamoylputrescine amidase [Deinococcus radiophilus]|uniref:N-carbamoylputrescine amidase n=1 Tax=Deinococcus radiophilus TaxID=32062 RepID=A0A431VQB5_9DEIO|nr:N-carbamoylputrescine amidase [Deinococcus radiophilus]RTR25327.1 N-carbamoylputrescine amidase [Deinococcus radiophilus]UFA50469.1 N-carbamoylputrescine amidase [Deinococcus radiophilus]